ncbi:hypothetical protein [Pseudonocardia spirodelae]|uniref:TrwC relaxase domain-containing protein n=1 Tax=Pseudonocardia spirodelae TaxID=3133431 RepID=A0ABU8T2M8_9PSEU
MARLQPRPAGRQKGSIDVLLTRYCGQGATVQTSHSVITDRTDHAAALVGLTRGVDANTAYVATVTELPDAADGSDRHQLHRSPKAVLTTAPELAEPDRSALAFAEESADWAGSVATAAELFADAAHQASVRRTTAWLDRLTDTGVLTLEQRDQLAAEDASTSLTHPLRRAEVSGPDPYTVLHDTITGQPLAGARNLTNVIHARMRDRQRFEPQVGTWTDRVPQLDDPQMTRYLEARRAPGPAHRRPGRPSRRRAAALGRRPPRPGPRPGRHRGPRRVGTQGRRGRGLPGADRPRGHRRRRSRPHRRPRRPRRRAEAGDGRASRRVLRGVGGVGAAAGGSGGVRAVRRGVADASAGLGAAAGAPRYVANELAGTRQAAEHHRHTAVLRRTESAAAALAAELDQRVGELGQVEAARGRWLLRTAVDREKHDRALIALAHRTADRDDPDDRVSADEWLAAHDEAMRDEDEYRPDPEHDLDEVHHDDLDLADRIGPVLETAVDDVRDLAAAEPRERHEDDVRVPTSAESEDAVSRARRALDEIHAQEVYEASQDTAADRDVDHAHEDPFADETDDGWDDAYADS